MPQWMQPLTNPEPGETLRGTGARRNAEGRWPGSSLPKLPCPRRLHHHPGRRQRLALPQAVELVAADVQFTLVGKLGELRKMVSIWIISPTL